MNIVTIQKEQYVDALHLSEYAFQYTLSEEKLAQRIEWMRKYHEVFAIKEGEEIAAKFHFLPSHIYFGQEKMKMGGIAAVATYPEHRRKGYINELFQFALKKMKEEGYTISMLHPFAAGFYRKYGFEFFSDRTVRTLAKEHLVMHKHVDGYMKRISRGAYSEDVNNVYEQYAGTFTGMLARTKDWWLQSIIQDGRSAVYYNKQGEARGYIIYDIENYKMTVDEFVALDSEARSGLWNFICQHDSMAKEVVMTTYDREPLFFSLHEPRMKTETKPYFMARIVDVESFTLQYEFEEGEVTLHISDEHAPWNEKTMVIKEGTVHVMEREEGSTSGLHMNINTLTTLLFGYKRPHELLDIGAISGNIEEVKQLEKVIPLNKSYFYDFF
ncbi:GNAT family N-acetyltransferase [Priestia taiwanensis]|uniref:Acetyltransferase n=1 Tax=Priestia taiwanensis TaxID=1347902 RepID=A0A917AWF2_9BACI|nr:GNAT family N-acetyltransferase [Priestia taiwanensis]MBM7365030.1 putative acetyltransferase [Priestia taiwanensis]GGE83513.1 acetyltransferase [Priestia taiwanensis]